MTGETVTASARAAGRPQRGEPPIRLMIVDDSPTARSVLSRMVSSHEGLEVAALAGSVSEALDALAVTRVDIVVLDVEMPGTSGLAALPDILRKGRGARVLVVSSLCEDGAEAAVRALTLGAADTLPKPGAGTFGGRFSEVLAERLRRIGRAPDPFAAALPPILPNDVVPFALRTMPRSRLGCLALGASTGGLHAVSEFLRGLPPEIGAPILVTQHLPAVFMPFFARQIEAAARRPAKVAEDGDALQVEQILVAPGDAHLGLERVGSRVQVKLSRAPVSSGCIPSVDSMLWALSEIYAKSGLGIVFSGMGRDGLVGSAQLVERGGAVMVQNQQTSAVWGMPRAVAEAGLASAALSPADLASRVAARAESGAWK